MEKYNLFHSDLIYKIRTNSQSHINTPTILFHLSQKIVKKTFEKYASIYYNIVTYILHIGYIYHLGLNVKYNENIYCELRQGFDMLNDEKYNQMITNDDKQGCMNMSKIGKVKHLEKMIVESLKEIEENGLEKEFYNRMVEYNILEGVTRKLVLNKDASEFPLSIKYLFAKGLYELTNNENINFDVFYNSETKLKFLNRYPGNTQISYARIFEKSKKYEESYNKDLSEFRIEEMEYVLHDLKPLTQSASHVNGRILTAYIDWSMIGKTNIRSNSSSIKDKSAEWFNQFVDKDIKLYFSDRDIYKLEEKCANYQDMVIIRLLFEGVQGKSLSEIRNLKKHDVDYSTGRTTLIDEDNSKRIVYLSERAINLIQKSNDLNIYYKKNGEMLSTVSGSTTNLVDNNYVIRTSITRTDLVDRPVDKMVIYRRIKTLAESLKGFEHLSANNIVRSGIIYEAKEALANGNKLDKDTYIRICSKYNISNWYPIKQYCNEETINKVYKKSVGYQK